MNGIAPFLIYDNDPYIVVSNEGRLFWMIDAFTESSTYPYSRHHQAGDNNVNYIRNSVKVMIDAYNGTRTFMFSTTRSADRNLPRNLPVAISGCQPDAGRSARARALSGNA